MVRKQCWIGKFYSLLLCKSEVNSSIELCLKNRNDYKVDTLKEAISILLRDEVPVLPLMRTVIRSAQAFPELKTFVFTEVVPRVLSSDIWVSLPRVWEGVVLALKILVDGKDIEIGENSFDGTAEVVVGLPVKPMQLILSSSPKLKTFAARYLDGLDSTRVRSLFIGKWSADRPEQEQDSICREKHEMLL